MDSTSKLFLHVMIPFTKVHHYDFRLVGQDIDHACLDVIAFEWYYVFILWQPLIPKMRGICIRNTYNLPFTETLCVFGDFHAKKST